MTRRKSLIRQVAERRLGLAVLILLGSLYLIALFAGFLAPYQTPDQDLQKTYHPPTGVFWQDGRLHVQRYELVDPSEMVYRKIEGEGAPIRFFAEGYEYRLFGLIPANRHLFQVDAPDRIYLLGSDETGRDNFSRLLYGSRISLSIGLVGISIIMVFGFAAGGFAGYFGGIWDNVTMRFIELVMAVPGLYLLLVLRSTFPDHLSPAQTFFLIVVILSFLAWGGTARIIRGMSLSLRNRQFVMAAEVLGQSSWKIIWKHILPNVFSYLVVAASLSIPGFILGEAALSFLGLGIQEPSASWGLMLSQAQDMKVFMLGFWWLLIPGAAIFVTVIAFNVLGDVLRDIVDPKQKFLNR
jgi:peptide/nickel transport system permease protein